MSVNIQGFVPPAEEDRHSDSGTESGDDDSDETWDDWKEDPVPCKSLFDDVILPSATESLAYDKSKHSFDLLAVCERLSFDFHQRARLINSIRKNKTPASAVQNLQGDEAFLLDDEYLKPVIEDDPLLQLQSDDWSDTEDDGPRVKNSKSKSQSTGKPAPTNALDEANTARRHLEAQLAAVQERLALVQGLAKERFASLADAAPSGSVGSKSAPKQNASESFDEVATLQQDNDSHYFESYGFQEIHAVMIQDSVRTSSYATFLLSNPQLFKGALVMDVGCGSGILSLFAARAGAKHVFAIDASEVALKARQNVKDNGLEDVITVIQGKVENITLPAPYTNAKVDVIVSEWMGYALLYESMLDSVLSARDRFLKKKEEGGSDGVMAPSQCRMVLCLGETPDVVKDKVNFWEDVYGFKMTSMAQEAYNDALVEHLRPEAVISNLVNIKDLPLQRITTRQLDFSSPFKLVAKRDGTVHSFVLWFDTWFVPDGSDVPGDAQPTLTEVDGNFVTAEIVQIGGGKGKGKAGEDKEKKPTEVSFSTGPNSLATHWKQSVFLLRNPFKVVEGSTVSGIFYCRKSESNTRELDVELHYSVSHTGLGVSPQNTTVQMFKVR